jgi:hypothetical protein
VDEEEVGEVEDGEGGYIGVFVVFVLSEFVFVLGLDDDWIHVGGLKDPSKNLWLKLPITARHQSQMDNLPRHHPHFGHVLPRRPIRRL